MATYNVNLNLSTAAAMAALNQLHVAAGKPINTRINFSQPLGRITGDVREFDKSLSAASARVTAFGAVAGSFYLVSKAVTEAAKSMMLVDKELIELNTFLGQSQGKLKEFGNSLFAIAKNTSTSFGAVSEAAKEFARQGLSMEETLKRTNDALVLSRISGLGAAESVTALTTAVNSFNKSGLTSSEVINKLIQVDSQFSVSSNDLAQALSRVGSSAQDSGLSIDQLVAAVTTAQQTTGRGGAVIGNALKTIFTRMKRPEVIDQLEAIGVAVKDQNGYFLDGLTILQNYTQATQNLSQAEKARTAELLGGIFQINVLNSLLNDVSKSNGIYARALRASGAATDEAFQKNEALNESLSATLERTKANLMQKGAAIAAPLLTPTIKTGAALINKTLNLFDKKEGDKEGEDSGRSFGESLLKGFGAALAGPGLLMAGAVALAIGKKVFSFGVNATKNLLGITTSSQNILNLQNLISSTLSAQPAIMQQVLAGQMSQTQAAQLLLNIMKQQGAQLQMNQTISSTLATTLNQGGFGVSPVVGLKRKAMGHIPKADQGMERAGALAGGYAPGAVVRTPSSIGGIMNTAEKVKHIPGFRQPFINPPEGSRAGNLHKKNSIKQTGINPYAYDGFIPNFYSPLVFDKNNKITLIKRSIDSIASPEYFEKFNLADGGIDNVTKKRNFKFDTISGSIEKKQFLDRNRFDKGIRTSYERFLSGNMGKKNILYNQFEETFKHIARNEIAAGEDVKDIKKQMLTKFNAGRLGGFNNFKGKAYETLALNELNKSGQGFTPTKDPQAPADFEIKGANPMFSGVWAYEAKSGKYNPLEIVRKAVRQAYASKTPSFNNDNKDGKSDDLNIGRFGLIATHNKGFIPNFAYLDNVKKLESKAGNGTAIFDTKPFPHVRNSSQPTFQSAINDHGGLKNALRDSASMQKGAGLIKSGGFIPNFGLGGYLEQKRLAAEAAYFAKHGKAYEAPSSTGLFLASSLAQSTASVASGFANEKNVNTIANAELAVPAATLAGMVALALKAPGIHAKAIGIVTAVLVGGGGVLMGYLGRKNTIASVESTKFQKVKDKVSNEFDKLTRNINGLSQSLEDIESAFSSSNINPNIITKLIKKQEQTVLNLSKDNPTLAIDYKTAATPAAKRQVLEQGMDEANKNAQIKASTIKLLETPENQRDSKAVTSFFESIYNQGDWVDVDVNEFIKSTSDKSASKESIQKSIQSFFKKGQIDQAAPIFNQLDPKMTMGFIAYASKEEQLRKATESQSDAMAISKRGSAAVRRENEKKQRVRHKQLDSDNHYLSGVVDFIGSNFGSRSSLESQHLLDNARISHSINEKFTTAVGATSIAQGSNSLFHGDLKPSHEMGKTLQDALGKATKEKERNELKQLIILNEELIRQSEESLEVEKNNHNSNLKLLGLQEKLAYGSSAKKMFDPSFVSDGESKLRSGAMRYQLGKKYKSPYDEQAGQLTMLAGINSLYPGAIDPKTLESFIDQSARTAMPKALQQRNEITNFLNQNGGQGISQQLNAISNKDIYEALKLQIKKDLGLSGVGADLIKNPIKEFDKSRKTNATATLSEKKSTITAEKSDADKSRESSEIYVKAINEINNNFIERMSKNFGENIVINNATVILKSLTGDKSQPTDTKASGFIPNFNNPLKDAIRRESKFVPLDSIRVNQSNKLVKSNNPLGLAVTNTLDEPRGLASIGLANNGYVPNFGKIPRYISRPVTYGSSAYSAYVAANDMLNSEAPDMSDAERAAHTISLLHGSGVLTYDVYRTHNLDTLKGVVSGILSDEPIPPSQSQIDKIVKKGINAVKDANNSSKPTQTVMENIEKSHNAVVKSADRLSRGNLFDLARSFEGGADNGYLLEKVLPYLREEQSAVLGRFMPELNSVNGSILEYFSDHKNAMAFANAYNEEAVNLNRRLVIPIDAEMPLDITKMIKDNNFQGLEKRLSTASFEDLSKIGKNIYKSEEIGLVMKSLPPNSQTVFMESLIDAAYQRGASIISTDLASMGGIGTRIDIVESSGKHGSSMITQGDFDLSTKKFSPNADIQLEYPEIQTPIVNETKTKAQLLRDIQSYKREYPNLLIQTAEPNLTHDGDRFKADKIDYDYTKGGLQVSHSGERPILYLPPEDYEAYKHSLKGETQKIPIINDLTALKRDAKIIDQINEYLIKDPSTAIVLDENLIDSMELDRYPKGEGTPELRVPRSEFEAFAKTQGGSVGKRMLRDGGLAGRPPLPDGQLFAPILPDSLRPQTSFVPDDTPGAQKLNMEAIEWIAESKIAQSPIGKRILAGAPFVGPVLVAGMEGYSAHETATDKYLTDEQKQNAYIRQGAEFALGIPFPAQTMVGSLGFSVGDAYQDLLIEPQWITESRRENEDLLRRGRFGRGKTNPYTYDADANSIAFEGIDPDLSGFRKDVSYIFTAGVMNLVGLNELKEEEDRIEQVKGDLRDKRQTLGVDLSKPRGVFHSPTLSRELITPSLRPGTSLSRTSLFQTESPIKDETDTERDKIYRESSGKVAEVFAKTKSAIEARIAKEKQDKFAAALKSSLPTTSNTTTPAQSPLPPPTSPESADWSYHDWMLKQANLQMIAADKKRRDEAEASIRSYQVDDGDESYGAGLFGHMGRSEPPSVTSSSYSSMETSTRHNTNPPYDLKGGERMMRTMSPHLYPDNWKFGLPTKSDGFVPAFAREKDAILSSPSYIGYRNATPMRSSVYKNTVINSAEIEVPAQEVYSRMFGSVGADIKPKNPSETHAILNPAQQQALGFSAGFIPNFSSEQIVIAIAEAVENGMSSFAGRISPSVSNSNVININDTRSYQTSDDLMMDGVLDILQSKYPKEMGKLLSPVKAKR